MARRLSDVEWGTFLSEVNVNGLGLPPWGGVVQWRGMYILVYVCPTAGTLCDKGEVMLTDVSDSAAGIRSYPMHYTEWSDVFWYELTQQAIYNVFLVARDTMVATGQAAGWVATQAGAVAGAVTGPILGQLTVPLIVAGVIAFLYVRPSR